MKMVEEIAPPCTAICPGPARINLVLSPEGSQLLQGCLVVHDEQKLAPQMRRAMVVVLIEVLVRLQVLFVPLTQPLHVGNVAHCRKEISDGATCLQNKHLFWRGPCRIAGPEGLLGGE